jgi:hypothetical protein
VVAAGGLVAATAGPASANAACGKKGTNLANTTVKMTAGVAANMRSGSSTSCGVTGWADNQDTLVYYCYTWDASNQSWTYLYNQHDQKYGWVKDTLLPNYGANKHCGF